MTRVEEILGHSDGKTASEHYVTKYLEPHAAAVAKIRLDFEAPQQAAPNKGSSWDAMQAAKEARIAARHRGFEPLTYGSGGRHALRVSRGKDAVPWSPCPVRVPVGGLGAPLGRD